MKSYILIVLNPKIEYSDLGKIIGSIGAVTDTSISKTLNINGINLFNFNTTVGREDLFVYFTGVLFEIAESFVLLDKEESNCLQLPDQHKELFLNLEYLPSDMPSKNLFMDEDAEDDFTLIDDVLLFDMGDEFDDDIDTFFEDKIRNMKPKLNIDVILDKISQDGLNSLTDTEKKYLKNYK